MEKSLNNIEILLQEWKKHEKVIMSTKEVGLAEKIASYQECASLTKIIFELLDKAQQDIQEITSEMDL